MGINEEEMLVETEGMNHSTGRKKTKVLKVVFLIYHVIVSLVLLAAVVLLLTPDAKIKLLSTPLGKYITRITITEEITRIFLIRSLKNRRLYRIRILIP